MPEFNAVPISPKCPVCGGNIINDYNYLAGTCVCAYCGNKCAITDAAPEYAKYSNILASITRADSIIDGNERMSSDDEARLLYKTAIMECNSINDAITAELTKHCNEGIKKAELLGIYIKGKNFFEKKSYNSCIKEFEKIPGYKDTDEIIRKCKIELDAEHKRDIPWAVVFSFIIPSAVAISLKVFAGWPLIVCILIFLAGSAGLGYVMYRGGLPSLIIKIISFLFLAATPIMLLLILAYLFHFPA